MNLHDDISTLKGVGPKKAAAFGNLNIHTLEDLAATAPRDYEDRRNVIPVEAKFVDRKSVV